MGGNNWNFKRTLEAKMIRDIYKFPSYHPQSSHSLRVITDILSSTTYRSFTQTSQPSHRCFVCVFGCHLSNPRWCRVSRSGANLCAIPVPDQQPRGMDISPAPGVCVKHYPLALHTQLEVEQLFSNHSENCLMQPWASHLD